jgi:hypothetical protein
MGEFQRGEANNLVTFGLGELMDPEIKTFVKTKLRKEAISLFSWEDDIEGVQHIYIADFLLQNQ